MSTGKYENKCLSSLSDTHTVTVVTYSFYLLNASTYSVYNFHYCDYALDDDIGKGRMWRVMDKSHLL